MALGTLKRFTVYVAIVSQTGLGVCGCRTEGSVQGPASGGAGGNAATASHSGTLGEIAFQIIRQNLVQSDPNDNPTGKVAALDARHQDFVTAIDTMVPASVAGNIQSTLDSVEGYIRDGTLPSLTDKAASILDLLANDPSDPQRKTLQGLATLLTSSRSAIGKDQALSLASRLLAYPDLDPLLRSIASVVNAHTGVDANGSPNGTRDLVSDLLALLSRRLEGLAEPTPGSPSTIPQGLVSALLDPIELRGNQVGSPAWAVRVDPNGNAEVAVDPATGTLYAPFIDLDHDGVADVSAAGNPIDANGAEIHIASFGSSGARDADNRALAADGRPIFDYFDAKQTTLEQVLEVSGKLLQQNVHMDLLDAIDKSSTRVQLQDSLGTYTGYADDNPLIDVAWGGLEVFRYRDAPKLLESMSALLRNDPRRAENILVHLVKVVHILNQTQFQGNSRQLLDQLIPLADQVFKSDGGPANADSLAINVLNTFRDSIQQVNGIPAGLARMMKYSVYPGTDPNNPGGTLVQPGQISCMEQLMDIVAEANQCDSWPFGNMANFYLDAIAGNQSINLGFTTINISVGTINQLLDISFLRNLLCSQINPDHVRALHAFALSGALDALTPIVKAFSDRHQTTLIKNIFLTLQANYPTSLRPNEPLVIQILESGVVEELFGAINELTTLTVPSTGEPVTNVLGQFIAAMVDTQRGVTDRHGQSHMTLVHLLLDAMRALSDRIDQSGARAEYDRAVQHVIDIALATTTVTPGQGASYEGLLYHGIVKLAQAGLKAAADGLSIDPAQRSTDITRYQGNIVSFMTGRDLPVLVDVLLTVENAPERPQIVNAIVNVFTPNLVVKNDIFGAVLEILAAVLQAKADPTAMVDVLHFGGKVLDPARGWSKPIVLSAMKLMSQDNVILTLVRNALDRGPNGTARSPADVLFSVLDDVNAQSKKPSGGTTAQTIADAATNMAAFIRDRDTGLEAIYTQIIGHPR